MSTWEVVDNCCIPVCTQRLVRWWGCPLLIILIINRFSGLPVSASLDFGPVSGIHLLRSLRSPFPESTERGEEKTGRKKQSFDGRKFEYAVRGATSIEISPFRRLPHIVSISKISGYNCQGKSATFLWDMVQEPTIVLQDLDSGS